MMTKIAAAVIALVYLGASAFILYHFGVTNTPSGEWDHVIVIYNSITSVGFTAIGVLLGTQVQQVNLNAAKADTAAAKADTAAAKADADKKTVASRAAIGLLGPAAADGGGSAPTPVVRAHNLLVDSLS